MTSFDRIHSFSTHVSMMFIWESVQTVRSSSKRNFRKKKIDAQDALVYCNDVKKTELNTIQSVNQSQGAVTLFSGCPPKPTTGPDGSFIKGKNTILKIYMYV